MASIPSSTRVRGHPPPAGQKIKRSAARVFQVEVITDLLSLAPLLSHATARPGRLAPRYKARPGQCQHSRQADREPARRTSRTLRHNPKRPQEQLGGSARCYQAIFVLSTALASPGYDGQPAVYIAGLRPNPTRHASAGGCRGPVGGFRLALKAVHNVTVHSPLAAVGWPLPAEPPAGAHDDATPYCR